MSLRARVVGSWLLLIAVLGLLYVLLILWLTAP